MEGEFTKKLLTLPFLPSKVDKVIGQFLIAQFVVKPSVTISVSYLEQERRLFNQTKFEPYRFDGGISGKGGLDIGFELEVLPMYKSSFTIKADAKAKASITVKGGIRYVPLVEKKPKPYAVFSIAPLVLSGGIAIKSTNTIPDLEFTLVDVKVEYSLTPEFKTEIPKVIE